jgi:hypothetical protein
MTRRALPDLPASRWHLHPAWESQAYDALVGFHDRYRRETSRLVAAAQDPKVAAGELRDAVRGLEEILHNHEGVEEGGLYPWIAARYDVDFTAMCAEHARLNEQLAATGAYLGEADPVRPVARDHLVRLDQLLRAHLAAEEALCVPVLLELSADAYADLTK